MSERAMNHGPGAIVPPSLRAHPHLLQRRDRRHRALARWCSRSLGTRRGRLRRVCVLGRVDGTFVFGRLDRRWGDVTMAFEAAARLHPSALV